MGIVQPMRFLAGQGLDGMGRKLCRLLPVRIQRVPGQVQAADLFFLLQQFGMGVFFEVPDLIYILGRVLCSPAHQ